jgi:hypothetical protein
VKQDLSTLIKEGEKIGFPLLVKATAGGGGKGMRVVNSETELEQSIESAKREAKSAFGNDSVFLEQYIHKPRHIEFQILADEYGHRLTLSLAQASAVRMSSSDGLDMLLCFSRSVRHIFRRFLLSCDKTTGKSISRSRNRQGSKSLRIGSPGEKPPRGGFRHLVLCSQ